MQFTSAEILKDLDLKDRTHLRERDIGPALADRLVERTIPDKPTSRLQKYRLTDKSREFALLSLKLFMKAGSSLKIT